MRHSNPCVSEGRRSEIHTTTPLSTQTPRRLCCKDVYFFKVLGKATLTVRKHSSREHTAMNILKRLWQWYSDRRIERRMLKGHGVYRT